MKAVLIIGGSLFSVPAVHAARELGLVPVVVDRDINSPACLVARELPGCAISDSIYDPEAILYTIEALQGDKDANGGGFGNMTYKGVFTCGHDAEVTVATIAEHFGLPGIPVEFALNCKNKMRTRQCLEKAGISQPDPPQTWWDGNYKYPVIVKPVDSCASRGTSIVCNGDGLRMAGEKALSVTKSYMIEELLSGQEYSVEILFDGDGKCHHLNVVDRVFETQNGVPMEVGHVNPTNSWPGTRDALFELAERSAKAVGAKFGAFKIDAILESESDILHVLEVTARLSGGFDSSHTTPLATGRNFIKAAMRVACGMPLDPEDLKCKWRKYAACYCPLTGKEQSNADRKEFRLAVADTYDEAWKNAKDGVDLVEVIRK